MELFINGVKAYKGMEVLDFRGDKWFLTSWKEPLTESSTGRVYVKKNLNDSPFSTREFFPSVINGKFE